MIISWTFNVTGLCNVSLRVRDPAWGVKGRGFDSYLIPIECEKYDHLFLV